MDDKSYELIDIFNNDDYPPELNMRNYIYVIENKLNNHQYVGQAKDLRDRFIYELWSHKNELNKYILSGSNNIILYNALRKYSVNNFRVLILESCLPSNELNQKEVEWIKKLHTCIYDDNYNGGYNMTWGGEDCSQLHTPESIKKSHEANVINHGGVYSFNTEESRQIKINRYGNVMGMCHTPEVRRKIIESLTLTYGNPWGAAHTKEVRDKIDETNIKLYGSKVGRIHSPEVRRKSRISFCFNSIENIIKRLKANNLELNTHNYWRLTTTANWSAVNELYDELKSDKRWTEEYDLVFKDINKYN